MVLLTCFYTQNKHNDNICPALTQLSLCFFAKPKHKLPVNNHSQSNVNRLVLLSGIVPSGLWKDSDIVMGVRAQQKERTRRSLVEAAFSQLSAERSFASLSLREVAREAGIAPTSFYRHFRDVDELGLTMVDESGLMLRQLMRQARQRIAKGGSVIRTSVSTFMEFIGNNPNAFRLLLRERSGTSAAFRAAVAREIQHFIAELADYLELENHMPRAFTEAQAEAMVTIVFNAGAEALDIGVEQRRQLEERLVLQLRMISKGAYYWYRREQEKISQQPDE
jgi:AcrR family transcriptional regulator